MIEKFLVIVPKRITFATLIIYGTLIMVAILALNIINEANKVPIVNPLLWKCDNAKNWGVYISIYEDAQKNKKYQAIEVWTDQDCNEIEPKSIGINANAPVGWEFVDKIACGALAEGNNVVKGSKFADKPSVTYLSNVDFSSTPSSYFPNTYRSYRAVDLQGIRRLFPDCVNY